MSGILRGMSKPALQGLAEAVKARRTELGLAQGDLASRGGPSVVVVGQIERQQQPHPQALTLSRLDRALAWEPGSAAAVLAGGRAHPLEGGQPAARGHLELGGGVRQLRPVPRGEPAVLDAIRHDPNLLPEAKEHLISQYGLLLRVQDQASPLPYVAHGERTTPVDPEEEAAIERGAKAGQPKPNPTKRRK